MRRPGFLRPVRLIHERCNQTLGRRLLISLVLLTCSAWWCSPALADDSLSEQGLHWPTWSQWTRTVLLHDYNTRIVVLGVAMLGGAAGLVGSFTLLRKRALMGDALSHAGLPGLVGAFMLATFLGGDGKSLPWLLLGATTTGLMGVGVILLLSGATKLKEDTALGIVLSVFFGTGVAMLGITQQMDAGHSAGLESFIYGRTASMRATDAWLIAAASSLAIVICLAFFKELKLLCFDDAFAGSRGFSVIGLDVALMVAVVAVTMVGLQAVGLILMVALLVIPAAAARFWTESMIKMAAISTLLGGLGGIAGAMCSALFPRLTSGAMIVLVCTGLFTLSLLFGTKRGVWVRVRRRRRLNRRILRQHLLRGMFELLEGESSSTSADSTPSHKTSVSMDQLLALRSWTGPQLRRGIGQAVENELLRRDGSNLRLTPAGCAEAARLTRQHRLWELYLLTYADVAPGRVDRDADDIEHVLEPEVVDRLEELLDQQPASISVPSSPHPTTPLTPEIETSTRSTGGSS